MDNPTHDQLGFDLDIPVTTGPEGADAPICQPCGRPARWIPNRREYGRYCHGNHCSSTTRICKHCGCAYEVGSSTGAGYRYCSFECKASMAEREKVERHKIIGTKCAWCENRSAATQRPEGQYLCAGCLHPFRRVEQRLRSHRVPVAMWQTLLDDPTCSVCHRDILTPVDGKVPLVVDHDHDCCPSSKSCGECVRGFLCGGCNTLLGFAHNDAERLVDAAFYLRSWRD